MLTSMKKEKSVTVDHFLGPQGPTSRVQMQSRAGLFVLGRCRHPRSLRVLFLVRRGLLFLQFNFGLVHHFFRLGVLWRLQWVVASRLFSVAA